MGNTGIDYYNICYDENVCKEGEKDMLIILGLILISLIVIVGGDRGVVSLIALVGNLLLLSFAIWLMATGVPVLFVTVGAGIMISCITLFYQNGTNVKTWSAFISVAITMPVFDFAMKHSFKPDTDKLQYFQSHPADCQCS